MKKQILALCVLLLAVTAFSKVNAANCDDYYLHTDTIPATTSIDTSIIFTEVDEEPKFKGDAKAWAKFLQKNLNAEIPVNKRAPNGQYTVIIQFLVEKDGTTKNYKALTRHGYGMEDECLRIIKLSGLWEPAKRGGEPVRYYRKQPITFIISKD